MDTQAPRHSRVADICRRLTCATPQQMCQHHHRSAISFGSRVPLRHLLHLQSCRCFQRSGDTGRTDQASQNESLAAGTSCANGMDIMNSSRHACISQVDQKQLMRLIGASTIGLDACLHQQMLGAASERCSCKPLLDAACGPQSIFLVLHRYCIRLSEPGEAALQN